MISGNNLAISVSRDLCQHQAIRWPVPFHLRLINSIFLNAYYRCAALASWNSRAGYLSAEWHSARKKSRLLPTQGERRLCHRGGPLRPGAMPPRDTNRKPRDCYGSLGSFSSARPLERKARRVEIPTGGNSPLRYAVLDVHPGCAFYGPVRKSGTGRDGYRTDPSDGRWIPRAFPASARS